MRAAAKRIALEDRHLHRNLPRPNKRLAIREEGVFSRTVLRLDRLEAEVAACPEEVAMRDRGRAPVARSPALRRFRDSHRTSAVRRCPRARAEDSADHQV